MQLEKKKINQRQDHINYLVDFLTRTKLEVDQILA